MAEERVPGVATAQLRRRGVQAVAGAAAPVERTGEIIRGVAKDDLQVTGEIIAPETQVKTAGALKRTHARQLVRSEIGSILNDPSLDIDGQMQAVLDSYQELGEHMQLRQARVEAARAAAPAPKFGSRERAIWEEERRMRAELSPVRPARPSRYEGVEWAELQEMEKVYQRFLNTMSISPVEEVPTPTVGRARFTERGEIIEEPTFATEAELQGYRATQAPLMRQFG